MEYDYMNIINGNWKEYQAEKTKEWDGVLSKGVSAIIIRMGGREGKDKMIAYGAATASRSTLFLPLSKTCYTTFLSK